jgi:hypothetical protein
VDVEAGVKLIETRVAFVFAKITVVVFWAAEDLAMYG